MNQNWTDFVFRVGVKLHLGGNLMRFKTGIFIFVLMAALGSIFAQTSTAPANGSGEVKRLEISGGYTFLRTDIPPFNGYSSLNGWTAGLQLNATNHFALVGEVGQQYRKTPIGYVHTASVVFGPRIFTQYERWRPFGEALFGVSAPRGERNFTAELGGGLDTAISPRLSFRLIKLDMEVENAATVHAGFKATTGLVFRFGGTL